jgi:hypothetical protein
MRTLMKPSSHFYGQLLERLGISGHELNPGSFERDWIRANSKVRLRL